MAKLCMHTYVFKYIYNYCVTCFGFLCTLVANSNCTDYCNNGGTCISPGLCICTGDWSGDNCTIRM